MKTRKVSYRRRHRIVLVNGCENHAQVTSHGNLSSLNTSFMFSYVLVFLCIFLFSVLSLLDPLLFSSSLGILRMGK